MFFREEGLSGGREGFIPQGTAFGSDGGQSNEGGESDSEGGQ